MAICSEIAAVLFGFPLVLFLFYAVLIVCVPFPFGAWDRMWNSIVSVPGCCFFLYPAVLKLRISLNYIVLLFLHFLVVWDCRAQHIFGSRVSLTAGVGCMKDVTSANISH